MLCSGHHLLRKSRSEKKLREIHERNDSVDSTTSSDILDLYDHDHEKCSSPVWDPLRQHPVGPRPVAIQRNRSMDGHEDGTYDHFGRPIVSRPPTRRPPPPMLAPTRRQMTPSVEINDSFDFGFTTKLSPPPRLSERHIIFDAASSAASPRRPSTSSSSSTHSFDSHSTSSPTSTQDSPMSSTPTSPAHSPSHGVRRPALSSPTERFMKHGSWKRRGIVFVSGEAHVQEEDCFDLSP